MVASKFKMGAMKWLVYGNGLMTTRFGSIAIFCEVAYTAY